MIMPQMGKVIILEIMYLPTGAVFVLSMSNVYPNNLNRLLGTTRQSITNSQTIVSEASDAPTEINDLLKSRLVLGGSY